MAKGVAGTNIGSGWVGYLLPAFSAKRVSWRGSRVKTMMQGNGVRVKSFETGVMRGRCARVGVVCRCTGISGASLSLSLSLSSRNLVAV